MIVVMEHGAGQECLERVIKRLEELGYRWQVVEGELQSIVGVIGESPTTDVDALANYPGVERLIRISEPYQLVDRTFKKEDTVVEVAGVRIGGKESVFIAGPCAIENREQFFAAARNIKEAGADILRAGAYKPRTSPYSFQGIEKEGLKLALEAKLEFGIPVIGEVMDFNLFELAADYLDIIQIGARNMQNYPLLEAAGRLEVPVLLKRGLTATYNEWLLAAERIVLGGNSDVILCERGIRTFVEETRNTLDLAAVPKMKKKTHLPVIVDPSHGTGERDLVASMSRAALAAGADGLMIEVHPTPEEALCDGQQSLSPKEFGDLMCDLVSLKDYLATP